MKYSKIDFINELLSSDKINIEEKKRVIHLTKEELKNFDTDNLDIKNRISNLENRFVKLDDKKIVEEKKQKGSDLKYPLINKAPSLVKLMNHFSDNMKALKYTTHSWEHGKFENYDDFMRKIKVEWNQIKDELKSLNPRLHAKISNFLFNEKLGTKQKENGYYYVWGEKRLKFGWASHALKKFMESNNSDPFACAIPEEIKKLDKEYNLLYFDNYKTEFKNEIEIREDNSGLEMLINNLWTSEIGYDFNVYQKDIEGKSFFTDVTFIKSTIQLIFKSFKSESRHMFSEIFCKVIENFNENYIELLIMQKNSMCRRSIDDPKIVNPRGGDFSSIIRNLKNLADFSIVSKFNDGNIYRINYLTSNENVEHIEKLEKEYACDGFTYVLKFYV